MEEAEEAAAEEAEEAAAEEAEAEEEEAAEEKEEEEVNIEVNVGAAESGDATEDALAEEDEALEVPTSSSVENPPALGFNSLVEPPRAAAFFSAALFKTATSSFRSTQCFRFRTISSYIALGDAKISPDWREGGPLHLSSSSSSLL